LSQENLVPFGSNLNNLIAEYVIIFRKVFEDKPEMFIIPSSEVKEKIHKVGKDNKNKISYWLETEDYEEYRDKWDAVGEGYE
jgi:hypothetical protein